MRVAALLADHPTYRDRSLSGSYHRAPLSPQAGATKKARTLWLAVSPAPPRTFDLQGHYDGRAVPHHAKIAAIDIDDPYGVPSDAEATDAIDRASFLAGFATKGAYRRLA
jgi:hypothetical protein